MRTPTLANTGVTPEMSNLPLTSTVATATVPDPLRSASAPLSMSRVPVKVLPPVRVRMLGLARWSSLNAVPVILLAKVWAAVWAVRVSSSLPSPRTVLEVPVMLLMLWGPPVRASVPLSCRTTPLEAAMTLLLSKPPSSVRVAVFWIVVAPV